MAELIVTLKDRELKRLRIDGVLTRIGRDQANELWIDNIGVSRLHCTIKHENGRFVAYDEGSSNGLFVNGDEVLARPLVDGDEIQLGKMVVTFRDQGEDEDLRKVTETAQIRMKGIRRRNPLETANIPLEEMGKLIAARTAPPAGSTRKHLAVTELQRDRPSTGRHRPAAEQPTPGANNAVVMGLIAAVAILGAAVVFLLATR